MKRLTSVIHPSIPWKASSKITQEGDRHLHVQLDIERSQQKKEESSKELGFEAEVNSKQVEEREV